MRILVIIALLIGSLANAQQYQLRKTPYIPAKVIYLDSTTITGLVKMNNSAFDLRFKEGEDAKTRNIRYKEVYKLITDPGSDNERTFQYLGNHDTKWKKFVELIYFDVISIYIGSEDELSIFYSEFDRSTLREEMNRLKYKGVTGADEARWDSIALPSGETMKLPIRYNYYFETDFAFSNGNVVPIQYYLLKEGDTKLIPVRPHKVFVKKYLQLFEDCPEFASDIEYEVIGLDDLPRFIEYYKSFCIN